MFLQMMRNQSVAKKWQDRGLATLAAVADGGWRNSVEGKGECGPSVCYQLS